MCSIPNPCVDLHRLVYEFLEFIFSTTDMFCGDTTSGNLDFTKHIVYDKESDPLLFALGSNYF